MAKPDCDDGYYKLSYELGAALFSFGFGEIEGHIIGLVLEAQYGFGKRKYVELSPAALSAEWDVPRQNVHRAIGNLVARNVLLSLGDNRYQFLKDYENWDKKGTPARVLLWKAFVADAPRRAKSFRPLPPPRERGDLILEGVAGVNDGADSVIFKDDTSNQADDSSSSSKMTNRHLQRLQPVIFKDDGQGVPPGPPIGEAHAELRSGEREKKTPLPPEGGSEGVEETFCCDPPETIPIPAKADPDPDPIGDIPRTFADLSDWVRSVTREDYVSNGLRILASGYAIDWVFHSLRCAAGKNIPEHRWQSYANGCLIRWHQNKGIIWDDVKRDTGSKHRDIGEVHTITPERKAEVRKRTYLGNTGTERF